MSRDVQTDTGLLRDKSVAQRELTIVAFSAHEQHVR